MNKGGYGGKGYYTGKGYDAGKHHNSMQFTNDKGKGKGKSDGKGGEKGKFQGACYFCGGWGHSQNRCYHKDQFMQNQRANSGKGHAGQLQSVEDANRQEQDGLTGQ